jgi:hypothetical protein|tara:strand:- start:776 stop:937 length:162 start_codon:yes stop_codon:yes gene_type:complete
LNVLAPSATYSKGDMVAAEPPVWFALAGSWWQIAGNEVIARKCLDRTGVFDTF